MTRGYLVQYKEEAPWYVQTTSPAKAAARVANNTIPSKLRWGGLVKVTSLVSGATIGSYWARVRTYRVRTERMIKRVEQIRE